MKRRFVLLLVALAALFAAAGFVSQPARAATDGIDGLIDGRDK